VDFYADKGFREKGSKTLLKRKKTDGRMAIR